MKNKVFIISIILWAIITLLRIANRVPWLDEAHAWTIAQQLNFFEIIDFMKIEGHLVVWYLLIMPFAKLNIGYPISMQLVNWIFCLFALIVLWKKAPFNNFLKVLITFSFPFLFMYSVYARCYSVGIFLLFLLTALFKEKTKRPLLYSTLLVLCANTSLMALIGATVFGILFLYDLYKEKVNLKSLISSFIVLLLGGILVLLCITGVDDSALSDYKGRYFLFSGDNFVLLKVVFLIFLGAVPLFFVIRKNFQLLFFALFVIFILTYIFIFRYYGHLWNHLFLYIYFLILSWLALDVCHVENFYKKVLKISLAFITVVFLFVGTFFKVDFFNFIFSTLSNVIPYEIKINEDFANKPIILLMPPFVGYAALPYLRNDVVHYCNGKDFFSLKDAFWQQNTEYCVKTSKNRLSYYLYKFDIKRVLDLMAENKECWFVMVEVMEENESTKNYSDEKIVYKDKTYNIKKYKSMTLEDDNHLHSIYFFKIKVED